MLDHGLKFEKALKVLEEEELDYVDYFTEGDHGNKRIGPPTIDDWKNVPVFVMFLKVFYDVTMKISGYSYVTSNSYFHELWGSQELLIEYKCEFCFK